MAYEETIFNTIDLPGCARYIEVFFSFFFCFSRACGIRSERREQRRRWQSRAKPIMDRAENIPGLRIDDWPVICVRLRKQAYTMVPAAAELDLCPRLVISSKD